MTKHRGFTMPTEPGWYWVRHGDDVVEVVYVRRQGAFGEAKLVQRVGSKMPFATFDFDGEWYGPLDSPFDD